LLAKAFNELIVVNENGKRRRITKREAMIKQLATKAAAGDFRWTRLAYEEAGKIEAKLEASRRKAKELDDQAEEELQCAVIRQLSYEERREHLDLLERAQKLVELAWDRYEKKGLTWSREKEQYLVVNDRLTSRRTRSRQTNWPNISGRIGKAFPLAKCSLYGHGVPNTEHPGMRCQNRPARDTVCRQHLLDKLSD
jgi:uncharacterized protein DUF5681